MLTLTRGRSRLVEPSFSMAMVFIGPVAACLVVFALLNIFGVDLGVNLSLVGLLFALLLPMAIELRSRTGRPRRVSVVDYRVHHFGHAVSRGVMRTLNADKRHWLSSYHSTGTSSSDGAVQWQVRQLQQLVLDDVDGVVLIPAGDSEDLWYALASVIKSGAFVVVVDTKPPHSIFREVGIDAPRFVSSRYAETGVETYKIIIDFLEDDPDRRAILWTGPTDSWPGEERSRNIIYGLAKDKKLDRATLMQMEGWTPTAARCRATLDEVARSPGKVAIYCADDENALALHLFTMTESPHLRQKMYVIGCNGTSDDWGSIPVIDQRAVEATIEILAEEQGVQAAMMMVKERNGKLSPSDTSVYISPRPLFRSFSANRWIDSLFEQPHVVVGSSKEASAEAALETDGIESDLPIVIDDGYLADGFVGPPLISVKPGVSEISGPPIETA